METSISMFFKANHLLSTLYGEKNSNLSAIEKLLKVKILSRGNFLAITGESDAASVAATLLEALYNKIESGTQNITLEDIKGTIEKINSNTNINTSQNVEQNKYVLRTRKKNIFAYTENQQRYISRMHEKDIVFSIGVAGTGKTYLAVAMAVTMFLEKKIDKIILSRPAVEAGEKLGFLPGDVKEKTDPYLQPLYDALYDMLPVENVERYIATKEIQIVPLAFMRGRTLNNAFIILDEAQNTTTTQMKMFLTRLGLGSRMVVAGDLSQIDLASPSQSGLIDAIEKLKPLSEVSIVRFGTEDIVRHPLIAKIIDAYENKRK
jgi:phosphate starvation-inducible protein PhoH and related proteins